MEKKSFFERLTGSTTVNNHNISLGSEGRKETPQLPQQDEEGQLTIDMWQTPTEIIIQTIVGGVKPEDVEVNISHEMVTIRGKRAKSHTISSMDYFYQELFWGTFSRTILLPQEVDVDESEAIMKHGLLILKLPKLDKTKIQKLRVKND
ncbi:MAG: Hsp20/alpha crystallin family protein [Patescibacteria group bacterium]